MRQFWMIFLPILILRILFLLWIIILLLWIIILLLWIIILLLWIIILLHVIRHLIQCSALSLIWPKPSNLPYLGWPKRAWLMTRNRLSRHRVPPMVPGLTSRWLEQASALSPGA